MRLLLALVVVAALGAQQSGSSGTFNPIVPDSVAPTAPVDDSPEAYPGQHDHARPPDGWTCHRPPVDLSGDQTHWCACERTCDPDTQVVHEDKACAVYCHADRCSCGMGGEKRCMPEGQN